MSLNFTHYFDVPISFPMHICLIYSLVYSQNEVLVLQIEKFCLILLNPVYVTRRIISSKIDRVSQKSLYKGSGLLLGL